MNRFVDIGGTRTNVDSVSNYWMSKAKSLHLVFTNNEAKTVPHPSAKMVLEDLNGKNHIVQIIPCQFPIYAVWQEEDNSHFAVPVHFLGLCADGEMRGLQLFEGYFDIIGDGNFLGLYYDHQLNIFPNLEKGR